MQDEVKIEISDLYKSFGSNKVLNGVNLGVKKNRSLVILGASGTGKSVLIKAIIGLIRPDKGSIKIDGQDILSCSNQQKKAFIRKCGFLFQSGALFDSMTVQENITFGAFQETSMTSDKIKDIALEKLEAVGLSDKILLSYPSELSGGMQKRVALARAICANPEIIFFDEPTTGLDPIMSNVINELIIKVGRILGGTTITITHDINSAIKIADDVALINKGKIVWSGTNEDLHNPKDPYLHQFINGLSEGQGNCMKFNSIQ